MRSKTFNLRDQIILYNFATKLFIGFGISIIDVKVSYQLVIIVRS